MHKLENLIMVVAVCSSAMDLLDELSHFSSLGFASFHVFLCVQSRNILQIKAAPFDMKKKPPVS